MDVFSSNAERVKQSGHLDTNGLASVRFICGETGTRLRVETDKKRDGQPKGDSWFDFRGERRVFATGISFTEGMKGGRRGGDSLWTKQVLAALPLAERGAEKRVRKVSSTKRKTQSSTESTAEGSGDSLCAVQHA